MSLDQIEVNPENRWRLETPGSSDWERSVRPGAAKKKYFMVSVDSHLMPPYTLFAERLDKKYHGQLPRIEMRDGQRFLIMKGMKDEKIRDFDLHGEDLVRSKSGGGTPDPDAPTEEMGLKRITDQARDGVDAEVIFPNGPALMMWSSQDNDFVAAQCRVYNDWAMEVCAPYLRRCNPVATLPSADIEVSVQEVHRVAKLGYRAVMMPTRPIFGSTDSSDLNYNLPDYDRLWAAIQDHDLTITYHVSTGKDPRGAKGNGGAIINYAVHSLGPILEPVVSMCSSGVFERFPGLRVATIEANAAWVPWMLEAMDESYRKHHMWVFPKLRQLPSEYYRSNCSSSFGEDRAAMVQMEAFGLENNLMWANDYPHFEGLWPHSAEAIERTFDAARMSEETRRKLLGLNAARVFRFEIPPEYL